jgi:septal ring factor EnvC (AmiA/AmiB activator)
VNSTLRIICGAVAASTIVVTFAGARQAPPRDRARVDAAARRAAERLKVLQKEADALVARETTLLNELRKLEVERQIRVEELAQIERETGATKAALGETSARAEKLKKTAEEERPDIEARLVQLYKFGRAGYWRLLLDVDDLRSMGRAYRTAAAMTTIDRARVLRHQQTLEALGRERQGLQARLKELAGLQQKATLARIAVDRAVAARTALVASIDARRDLNAQLAGELQSAHQRLQASVAQLDQGRAAIALPLRPFQGDLPWPAPGPVSRPFGRQGSGRSGTSISRNGVQLAVTPGQPVRAVHEGAVAFADQFTGYGNLVIVDHGDRSYSLYGHLESLEVERGDRVDAQSVLGQSGLDPGGNPALYFELRVDGAVVDPLQWLKRQPIRAAR